VTAVAVVTTSRADYGIYRPLLRSLAAAPDLDHWLIVSGSHLSVRHGMTVSEIDRDGEPIGDRVDLGLTEDTPLAAATASGAAVIGFAEAFERRRPDLVVVLGDRYEMHAAAVAAAPMLVPVVHLHGGELSAGAFDDSFRHATTKLAHLHLVATAAAADRVLQLGEEPWRVQTIGALALDDIVAGELADGSELASAVGLSADRSPVLVALHAATLDPETPGAQAVAVADALGRIDGPFIVTGPNADPGGDQVRSVLRAFVDARDDAVYVENLGARLFRSALAHARVLVGNSSSGIIEAASFGLPVVNVGGRQEGRDRAGNVIDAPYDAAAIVAAVKRAEDPEVRAAIARDANPYGDGHAAERAIEAMRMASRREDLLRKRWVRGRSST